MKRIDLRYPLAILSFYAPGLLLLIGARLIGYNTEEVRQFVAEIGIICGTHFMLAVLLILFIEYKPIWWEFRK